MKHFLKAIPALTLAVLFVACSEGKKLNDMHDATLEMNDTTKQLAKTSDDMKATTQSVNDVSTQMNKKMDKMTTTTETMAAVTERVGQVTETVGQATQEVKAATHELYDAARQGDSLALRRAAIKELISAHSAGMKVAQAGEYFMSLEFQLWNNQGQDAVPGKREALTKDAVAEFFKILREFDSGSEFSSARAKSDGVDLISNDNKDAGFNALAAALHRVNRKQEEMHAKNPDVPVISMLSLIQDALVKEKDLREGRIAYGDLSPTQNEILLNRDAAIRLLQARHNFIGMIFLGEVSPILQGTIAAGKAYYLGWSFELDKYSEVQLREYTRYLRAIQSTQKFLSSIGIKPVVDKTMGGLMSGASVKTDGKGTGAVNAARTDMLGALKDVQKDLKAL